MSSYLRLILVAVLLCSCQTATGPKYTDAEAEREAREFDKDQHGEAKNEYVEGDEFLETCDPLTSNGYCTPAVKADLLKPTDHAETIEGVY